MKIVELHDNNNETLNPKVWLPIGSLYWNKDDISETIASCFYGTWQRYAKGKVIVGVDENDSDFTSNKTGGEKAHTLTVNEMPSHNHSIAGNWGTGNYIETIPFGSSSTAVNHNIYTDSTGGGQAHNNLQPYQTAYCWIRVS